MRPNLQSLLLTLLFAFGAASVASAREEILAYDTHIDVLPSGALEVSETITVRVEGQKIRRGIFRDFQTVYRSNGRRTTVGFDILDVRMDGAPATYRLLGLDFGKRLRIGEADRLVERGVHTYSIRFRTDRQIKFFPDYDELTYQAIAYGWDFPILKASATVELPSGAEPREVKVSAGARGAGAGGASVTTPSPGVILFEAERALASGEGMTIALAWPPGHVERPTRVDRVLYAARDNVGAILAWLGFLGTLGFYVWAWLRVGRDPRKGTIIAHYDPPDGISPAAMRYVMKQEWDDTAFSAAIVNLAVKGVLTIEENTDGDYILRRTGAGSRASLSSGERVILDWLFDEDGGFIEIDQKNHAILASARTAQQRALRREHLGVHFHRNRTYFIIGSVFSVAIIVASLHFALEVSTGLIVILTALALLNPLFAYLLRAPTMKGRKLMDEVEGFKRYLSVAEKDRMNFHNPPDRTPELFERYLPFAIALGVEHEWGEQFDGVLTAARDSETGEAWRPRWYHGRHFGGFGGSRAAAFAGALGGSMASSFTAAASPPASTSSSSFGGGGFSGGGGGGGGGGGW